MLLVGEQTVNEVMIQAATVNGSGSQSANLVLLRAIFSMGIPVASKNIFPSNHEGLPTWYQLRASAHGYQASKADLDLLIGLNPQTWRQDLASLRPGGVVVHEDLLPSSESRQDLLYYPVPFLKLAKDRITDQSLRRQLTNMLWVGVVAGLLDIPLTALEYGVMKTFPSKPHVWPLNMAAISIGHGYWRENFRDRPCGLRLEPIPGGTDGQILIEGNEAAALGCLMGGCTVAAWYPITPASSLCESLIAYGGRFRRDPATGKKKIAIIQAEDEIAALGMAVGAGWSGARAMAATSGPGISLMAEFTGFAYYTEIPVVIFDVQRVGPSTGLPTRTSQADLAFAHTLSHGDTRHPVILPATVEEAYRFAAQAFDVADRLQTPVFVLSDLDLGMNLWMSTPFAYPERDFDRGKVLSAEDLHQLEGQWARYRDVDGDGIPYRTLPGTDHPAAAYFTRGTGHDEDARYSEAAPVYAAKVDRLARKIEAATALLPSPETTGGASDIGLIAFGTTHHAVIEARALLAEQGLSVDYLRITALPLHPLVAEFVQSHERVYVIEQNRDGQMHQLLRFYLPAELGGRTRSIRHYDGRPIPASVITRPLLEMEATAIT
jgi:2-oxoglutarate/2-oxoacid ferredoxin oxidoreductase subunit alpha